MSLRTNRCNRQRLNRWRKSKETGLKVRSLGWQRLLWKLKKWWIRVIRVLSVCKLIKKLKSTVWCLKWPLWHYKPNSSQISKILFLLSRTHPTTDTSTSPGRWKTSQGSIRHLSILCPIDHWAKSWQGAPKKNFLLLWWTTPNREICLHFWTTAPS